jgi:hypothetical protein
MMVENASSWNVMLSFVSPTFSIALVARNFWAICTFSSSV